MKIVIPAAGFGQRFQDAGYDKPKPLIDVLGKPMVGRVIDNVIPDGENDIYIVVRKEQGVDLKGVNLVEIEKATGGAVETVLAAREYITDEPLLIANCDQLVDFDVNEFVRGGDDGCIVTFRSNKPHHSYVRLNESGGVTHIAEKVVISNHAVTGVYYFKNGKDFLEAADAVIKDDLRVRGEYYISTVLEEMIRRGKKITIFEAPSAMLGTPEELQLFEAAVRVGRTL